jgi:hypothetical protein
MKQMDNRNKGRQTIPGEGSAFILLMILTFSACRNLCMSSRFFIERDKNSSSERLQDTTYVVNIHTSCQ